MKSGCCVCDVSKFLKFCGLIKSQSSWSDIIYLLPAENNNNNNNINLL